MKILIIHYRFYQASGPERYLFNISKLLKDKGHVVIPFSLNYSENEETSYSNYFPEPVLKEFNVSKVKSIPLQKKIKIIKNSFFNEEVFNNLNKLIRNEGPDIAYVLQYGNKLSTSVFDACKKNKLPVVLRLSDFNLICSKNIFYRNKNVCTKCLKSKAYSVKYKCVHDSWTQSFVYFLTEKFNEFRKFEKKIDAIIAPSNFTISKFKKSRQFGSLEYYHIPTFFNNIAKPKIGGKQYNIKRGLRLCFVGRVAEDKGLDILIRAIGEINKRKMSVILDIYGGLDNSYASELFQLTERLSIKNVFFKGYINSEDAARIYNKYHFSVIPSRWYDNMPNSLIESSYNGVPVIVSEIGSLKELIQDKKNGLNFKVDDVESLVSKLEVVYNFDDQEYDNLSRSVFEWITSYCSKENHYIKLEKIFNKVVEKGN